MWTTLIVGLFLERALGAIHPKLVHLEYVPQVPPPLDYAQQYQQDLLAVGLEHRPPPLLASQASDITGLGRGFPGCSLAAFLSRAPGYALSAASDDEALLVRRDLLDTLLPKEEGVTTPPVLRKGIRSPLDAWTCGALCHPLRSHVPGSFEWGFDFRALADPSFTPEERLNLLDDLLKGQGASSASYELKLSWPRT